MKKLLSSFRGLRVSFLFFPSCASHLFSLASRLQVSADVDFMRSRMRRKRRRKTKEGRHGTPADVIWCTEIDVIWAVIIRGLLALAYLGMK